MNVPHGTTAARELRFYDMDLEFGILWWTHFYQRQEILGLQMSLWAREEKIRRLEQFRETISGMIQDSFESYPVEGYRYETKTKTTRKQVMVIQRTAVEHDSIDRDRAWLKGYLERKHARTRNRND